MTQSDTFLPLDLSSECLVFHNCRSMIPLVVTIQRHRRVHVLPLSGHVGPGRLAACPSTCSTRPTDSWALTHLLSSLFTMFCVLLSPSPADSVSKRRREEEREDASAGGFTFGKVIISMGDLSHLTKCLQSPATECPTGNGRKQSYS